MRLSRWKYPSVLVFHVPLSPKSTQPVSPLQLPVHVYCIHVSGVNHGVTHLNVNSIKADFLNRLSKRGKVRLDIELILEFSPLALSAESPVQPRVPLQTKVSITYKDWQS